MDFQNGLSLRQGTSVQQSFQGSKGDLWGAHGLLEPTVRRHEKYDPGKRGPKKEVGDLMASMNLYTSIVLWIIS